MPLGANPTIRPDFTMFRQEEDAEDNDLRGQQFFSHLYQLLLPAELRLSDEERFHKSHEEGVLGFLFRQDLLYLYLPAFAKRTHHR